MNAKTIVISNEKGGIGKSTTCLSMSSILARDGKKVLIIDTDRQGNVTDTLKAKIEDTGTLYDVVKDSNVDLSAVIQHTDYENLDIIASDPLLIEAEEILKNDTNGMFRIKKMINRLKDSYDYYIIDTAPNIGIVLRACLCAATDLIIPVTSDRYALQGLSRITQEVDAIREIINPDLRVMGLLLTNFKSRTNLSKEVRELLKGIAENLGTELFETEIRACNKVSESQTVRTPLITYAPNCTAFMDYESWIEELERKEML